ncbi:LTA synthase family protein [Bacteroidota bacterium]
MKNLLVFILKLFSFWIILFFVYRQVFLFFHFNQLAEIPFSEVLWGNWWALSMDIASACYFMVVPVIILFITGNQGKLVKVIAFYFSITLIILSAYINSVDIGLSLAWGSRFNAKALSYLSYPKEALGTMGSSPILALVSTFLICSILAIWVFKKYIYKNLNFKLSIAQKIISPIILLAIIGIGARGGLQTFPIGKHWPYYSTHNVLNLAATNGNWNMVNILAAPDQYDKNPYAFMSINEAESIVKQLNQAQKDTTVSILKSNEPNIVFIMLESWTNDIVERLGGDEGITPQFNQLCDDGLLFTNMYANGFRTEQGLVAYNAGFPAQPKTTIMRKFGKFESLPSFADIMLEQDYNTYFYYGGSLDFANTLSYLQTSGFETIKGQDDFEYKKTTVWGAYDEELFRFFLEDSENRKEPFLSMMITLTSHEPYDAEVEYIFPHNNLPNMFRNTAHYTDKWLGDFMQQAKTHDWYANTLFIILADHSHSLPMERKLNEPERHFIPCLFYGDVLKDENKGKIIDTYASQIDIPATLLSQLNIPHNEFFWSKDLFNPTHSNFAYYTFNEGFGYITSQQTLVWDQNLQQIIITKNPDLSLFENEKLLKEGQAILQVLMEQYVGVNH